MNEVSAIELFLKDTFSSGKLMKTDLFLRINFGQELILMNFILSLMD